MDIQSLLPHAKMNTTFTPLDAADLMRVQHNPEELNEMVQDLLSRDLPTVVKTMLEEMTGKNSTYSAEDRQRDFVRQALGTTGMDYPEDEGTTPDYTELDDEEDDGMMMDFGDDEPETTEESPMQPLASAFFQALQRAAQRTGQASAMMDIINAAHACNETSSIVPLFPIFSKKENELMMMVPHLANDAVLEKEIDKLAETIPFATTCKAVLDEARTGIANGIKPMAVLASAFFFLMAEKG